MPEERIRIVVVDDSALFRRLIRDVLRKIPGCSIVGNAENGIQALNKIEELKPDLITLDVEMPDMNGIDVLREMNKKRLDSRAIMVSKLTKKGAQVTTDALLEGAFDFVLKPSGNSLPANQSALLNILQEKISIFQQSRITLTDNTQKPLDFNPASTTADRYDAVLIGTSTGGPAALRDVLPKLPADFPVPILVVQHMPPQYTSRLASRLNDMCALKVREAKDNMTVSAGTIYIAPGGQHMKVLSINGQTVIRLTEEPPEHGCRPAIDYLFRSAVKIWKERLVGVIMTGMGKDGTEGCRLIREQGGFIFAQSEEDCVVYGMPKSVIENNISHRIVNLLTLPVALVQRVH